jgi:hypothetical protein
MESDGGKRGERRLVIRENSDGLLRVYAITLGDVGDPAIANNNELACAEISLLFIFCHCTDGCWKMKA